MRARALESGDGSAFLDVWKQHLPAESSGYSWIPEILDDGCERELFRGTLIHDDRGRISGLGLSCFLDDAAVTDYLRAPHPFWNMSILRALRDGQRGIVLGIAEQANANLRDGLNLVILEGAGNPRIGSSVLDFTVANAMVSQYIKLHMGYNIKRHLHEIDADYADLQTAGGNLKLADFDCPEGNRRALYGMSRDLITRASVTGHAHQLMNYTGPNLCLIPREQRLITLALEGKTDAHIAATLSISRDAIKQHWSRIYDVFLSHVPEVFDHEPGVAPNKRGPERRRLVLAYCAQRPSELRPHHLKRT